MLDKEPERLAAFLNTYLTISRRFYTRYPADGGCNEGPSYWRHAVGKYIQLLAQLDQRLQLNGKLFDDDKLRKMCEYLPGMNLCGNWFLNTNDAYPKPVFSPEFLYFSAQKINSIQLAELAQRISPPSKNTRVAELDNLLLDIFNTVPAKRIESSFLPVNFWPQLGIAILRQKPENPEKGTIVSLKGGFNAESHNHLDLGNFTLMRNKKPLIVDVGPGVYTAQTFSERRYEIWHLGAQGHNAPRFSGKEQIYGKEYSAALTLQKDTAVSACLDKAYPPEAGVSKLTRTLALDRVTGNVDITDTAVLTGSKKVEITLYTAVKPENFARRQVVWKQGRLETEQLEVVNVSEETRMDATLKKNWKKLWRIDLAGKSGKAGTWKLKFRF